MKFWDPVTGKIKLASIDWCELNYEVSEYIVEFWNTLSSLSFVLIGLANLILLRGLKGTLKEKWISCLYIVVGLGSAAFHGTLKFNYQLWDEIPMVWVISSALYSYFTLKPSSSTFQWKLLVFFLFYDAFWMAIHSNNAFVVFFQTNFTLMYITMIWCMFKYQREIGNANSGRVLTLHTWCVIVAGISWLTDNMLCEHLNNTVNPQLHSWWHVFMSLSAHYALLFEIVLRYAQEKKRLILGGNVVVYGSLDKHIS